MFIEFFSLKEKLILLLFAIIIFFRLANALLEKETLDLRAIIEILGERPFPPKSNFKAYLESKSSQDKEQKEKEEKHSQEPLPNAA